MVQINTELNKMVAETEKSLRDSAYVIVGLGVLGFQRAAVRRRELAGYLETDAGTITTQLNETAGRIGEQLSGVGDRLSANLASSREQLTELARAVDEKVAPTRAQLDQQVDAFGERLPASARNILSTVRSALSVPEASLRSAVGLD